MHAHTCNIFTFIFLDCTRQQRKLLVLMCFVCLWMWLHWLDRQTLCPIYTSSVLSRDPRRRVTWGVREINYRLEPQKPVGTRHAESIRAGVFFFWQIGLGSDSGSFSSFYCAQIRAHHTCTVWNIVLIIILYIAYAIGKYATHILRH